MSIRFRLTLLYSAVLAVTLLGFGTFLYLRTDHNEHAQVDRSLQSIAAGLQPASLGLSSGGSAPQNPPPRPGGEIARIAFITRLGDPAAFVQVDDANGQIVAKSPSLGEDQLPAPKSTARHFEDVEANHVPLRMLVMPVSLNRGQFTLLVARSLVDTSRTLDQLRFILIAGSLVCLAAAGIAGWLLARNALAPIARLTDQARDIGRRQDFKRRVEHEGPDDEVGRLAATFNTMLDSLDAAHERVRRALEAQRRFVADASHELRTPLTTIRGNVELLCLEGSAAPDQQEALADIASEAERMSRLVNNLLALARADAGFHIPRTAVAVDAVVAEAVQKARHLADGVALHLGENAPAVAQADHDYLLQLLLILLDNALKYTPSGGSVRVTSVRAGDSVRIAVQDTGPGIPPEQQQHIFDRFYRADPSRHGEGTGLGLSIANWIAGELSGRIELNSRPGAGSTFTVVLPATAPVPAPEPDEAHSAQPAPAPLPVR